jgi:hypothetical protein
LRNSLVALAALLTLALSEQPVAEGSRLRVEGQRPVDLRGKDNFRAASEPTAG